MGSSTRVLSRREYDVARRDFELLDKDGSGLLEKPEVAALLRVQSGRELTSAELDAAFSSMVELDADAEHQVKQCIPL